MSILFSSVWDRLAPQGTCFSRLFRSPALPQ